MLVRLIFSLVCRSVRRCASRWLLPCFIQHLYKDHYTSISCWHFAINYERKIDNSFFCHSASVSFVFPSITAFSFVLVSQSLDPFVSLNAPISRSCVLCFFSSCLHRVRAPLPSPVRPDCMWHCCSGCFSGVSNLSCVKISVRRTTKRTFRFEPHSERRFSSHFFAPRFLWRSAAPFRRARSRTCR